jgi:hypothetical protein
MAIAACGETQEPEQVPAIPLQIVVAPGKVDVHTGAVDRAPCVCGPNKNFKPSATAQP